MLKNIVIMAFINSEEGIEISFKTVEKEDEEVEVRFFLHNVLNPYSKIRISYYPPNIEIRNILTTEFNKSGLKTIYRISKSGFYCYYRICDIW